MKRYNFLAIILSVIIVLGMSCANESGSGGSRDSLDITKNEYNLDYAATQKKLFELNNIVIVLTTSGELEQKLYEYYEAESKEATDIVNLVITGIVAMNANDFITLQTLTNLSTLDISGTRTTVIPASQFKDNATITQVLLPDTLTTIQADAFRKSGLTSVIIPASVMTWGTLAFAESANLTEVTLVDGLKTMGQAAFAYTDVRSITIPASIPHWGWGGAEFLQSANLTEIILAEGLTTIGDGTFASTGVTSVIIPASVTEIGMGSFRDTHNLVSVTLQEGLEIIGKEAFNNSGLTSVTIPASVTSLGLSVFSEFADASNLSTVYMKRNSPPSINYAFPNTITNIYVPRNSVDAYKAAPNWFSYRAKISEPPYNPVIVLTTSGELEQKLNEYYEADNKEATDIINLVIAGNVALNANDFIALKTLTNLITLNISGTYTTVIPANQFKDNTTITQVLLPDTLTTIETQAFRYSGLTSVIIPASVVTWGDYTFADCVNLTNVTLVDGLTTIGTGAFSQSRFTGVSLPDSLTTIGDFAFFESSLESVTIPVSLRTWGDVTFAHSENLGEVFLPEGLETIGRAAFIRTNIGSITIPASVTSIADMAFLECSDLTTVTSKNPTPPAIGLSVFDNSVTNVYVPGASIDAYKVATRWTVFQNIIRAIP